MRKRDRERERKRARERERESERDSARTSERHTDRVREKEREGPLLGRSPGQVYRGASLVRNSVPLGPYSRTMPRVLGGS